MNTVTSTPTNTPTPTATSTPTPYLTLVKAASSYMVHPLDVITYTLTYSNPTVATMFGALLTDNLPFSTLMTYMPGSASNGGVYNSSTNSLTWNIPSIAPGSSGQVTYQIQAGFDPSTSSTPIPVTTLVNKAC